MLAARGTLRAADTDGRAPLIPRRPRFVRLKLGPSHLFEKALPWLRQPPWSLPRRFPATI
jgi:hypothetical protein